MARKYMYTRNDIINKLDEEYQRAQNLREIGGAGFDLLYGGQIDVLEQALHMLREEL